AIAFASTAAALAAGLMLVGAGTGLLAPALLALLSDVTPPETRGSGVAMLQLFGDAGATVGPLLGTVLLSRSDVAAYVGSAALLVLLLPVAAWLGAVERQVASVA
ncbi:MAG TPA: MFS transporter, partial [Anaeromyxobacteraceae bacterium]